MADALLGVAFENLMSLLQNELSTMFGIRSKVEKLSTTLNLIKAVLEDAEKKQLTDLSIKVWLQELKDAVYVLDDILDECSIESNRLKRSSAFKPKNIIFRHKIGNRLKEITSRFDEIAERKNKFLLQEGVTAKEMTVEVAEWRQTSSIIAEPIVYGREADKEKIVEFLINKERDSNSLSVYPIVGLGGVGKTTLTQLVYNDQRVSTTNFDPKIWVCVSEAFSVKRILCSIIESITSEKCDALDLDVIQRKAQELLQGKRFLLVLDDVWNKNEELKFGLSQEKWNQLKSVLSSGSKGSSCLVSTRDEVVASVMGTCEAHRLSVLTENDCWLLFKQYAFGIDREEQVELVEIGKEIAKKCRGLPLAAQALGGLMRSRSGVKEWLEIKESKLCDSQSDNNILPALRLSYSYLTPTLKQCFTFCAIFPKDRKMWKEELIHLWMANGFISSRKNLEVEDVGNMIWNELCQKSFFQDIQMDEYYGDISFKMHDLVHDLAQSIMGQECLSLEDANMTSLSKSTHHISVYSKVLKSIDEGAFTKVESLRTFFQLDRYLDKAHDCFPTNHFLRVLRTSFIHAPSLGSLIHLRYLELQSLDIETLPDSIYMLQKLEILKIRDCDKLSCLPKEMVCLQNLRHLVIDYYDSLSRLFPNIGKLSCLRTLSLYFVSLEKGNSLAELRDLNLGGKLSINGLNNVGSLSEAQEANLMCKKDLQELWLSWKRRSDESTKTPSVNAEQVLEVLQPHSNLKRLKIDYYEGLLLPSWISSLSNLVSLELWNCENCVQLPSMGKLQSLKKLTLWDMVNLKYLNEESHDGMGERIFPSLEVLYLSNLPNIERLLKVERGDMFPCLSHLRIDGCPKIGLPFLPSVKELSVEGWNNEELLRSISTFCSLTTLTLGSLSEAQEANLMFKKDLQELWLSWKRRSDESTKTPSVNAEQVLEVLQPHSNLKRLKIDYYEGLLLPSCISSLSNLVSLELSNCENCVQLPSMGKLPSLKALWLSNMDNLKYLNEESHDGMGVRIFPSLEVLHLTNLRNIEGLLKVERGDMFPCLSELTIILCPKLGLLPCLPSLKELYVRGCNNEELLRSISTFCGLTDLTLIGDGDEGITSFPEGMFTNLTFLQTLRIRRFPKLKELPNEPFNLPLEYLKISGCDELESLPEQNWGSQQSLRSLDIWNCKGLRCLPESIRHLTSLESLSIDDCPTLKERCKEGTGEDWDKIAHIPKLVFDTNF